MITSSINKLKIGIFSWMLRIKYNHTALFQESIYLLIILELIWLDLNNSIQEDIKLLYLSQVKLITIKLAEETFMNLGNLNLALRIKYHSEKEWKKTIFIYLESLKL